RVRVRHDVDRGGKVDVAADMVVVGVAVDDADHGLRGQLLDLRDERLAPSRNLGIDDGDAFAADEDRGMAAAAPEDEQVVLRLVHLNDVGAVAAPALSAAAGSLIPATTI